MQKESKTDRWLRTGFVLFMLVLLMLIIFNGTAKTSDVSNWIIAFANIAMAAAAVKAWLAARKFLADFFAQEGYRLAIELINENVIHLGIDNEFTVHIGEAIVTCSKLNGQEHADCNLTRFKAELNKVVMQQNNHIKWLSNVRSLSFRMETYGIYVAEGKKTALTEMVLALDGMVQLGNKLLPLMKADFAAYDEKIRSRTNFYMPFSSAHLTEMQQIVQDINDEWNLMVKSRNILLSGGKHARTLFVVREN